MPRGSEQDSTPGSHWDFAAKNSESTIMTTHGITISLREDGLLQLTGSDGASIELAPGDIRQLAIDMAQICIPEIVRESAMEAFNDNLEAVALSFISPAYGLGWATPMSMCSTEEGRLEVVRMYKRIDYGIYL